MTYERFEDTPVWRAAQALGVDVFALVEDAAFDRKGDLRDQLQRAVLSISNNIAEGFERGTTEDLLWFLYIARGSAGEVRSALRIADSLMERGILKSQISNLKSQISNLLPRCESVSRQLRGWADHLQNTDLRGQRHLNDATRQAWQQGRRTKQFLQKLNQIREGAKAPPAAPAPHPEI
jgi:four helix bundle protein